jgi:hypothetical protein
MVEIKLSQPLAGFADSCAIFCQVDCCKLNAFDVNAHTMLHYMRNHPADVEEVGRQLDALIAQVAVEKESVRILDLCYQWPAGAACAEYFGTWREQFSRARAFGPSGMPPAQRLAHAAQRGELAAEAYRMANEGAAAEGRGVWSNEEERGRAVGILVALARLDPSDARVRSEAEYARRVLTEQGVSWTPVE